MYRLLNEVVSQKIFKWIPLKLNSATFGDITDQLKPEVEIVKSSLPEMMIFVSDLSFYDTKNPLRLSD